VEPGAIVFRRTEPRDAQGIYTMNPDGSDVALVVPVDGGEWPPAWAPDGSAIVFDGPGGERTSQLFRIDVGDWSVSRLTDVPDPDGMGLAHMAPSFSPDGSGILFSLKKGPPCYTIAWTNILLANADATDPVQLTDGCGGANVGATFSPDGSLIAFQSRMAEEHDAGFGNFDVFVMDRDGANQRRLTELGTSEESPVWSPDGTHLYFNRNRQEIWSVKPDGSEAEQLWSLNYDAWPEGISPDGKLLLLSAAARQELYTLDLATGSAKLIFKGGCCSSWRR
jgi:Tol biopolymer transport system component